MMLFQLLFLLIAACSAQALPAGSPKKPGMPGVTPSSKMADLSVLGKLRQEMVQWYCPEGAHADEPPCKVYSFLQKLKVRTPPPPPPILAPRFLPPPLLTARTAPHLWGLTLPDLASRMQGTLLTELRAPDDALLSAVLMKLFADRQLRPRAQKLVALFQ